MDDVTTHFDGGCSCGAVRYRLTAVPMFVHCCHCRYCQKETGSAFVVNAMIEGPKVEILSGQPEACPLPTESGNPHIVYRCPNCRVALWSEYSRGDKLRFVRVGTLDAPDGFAPDVHIYTASKAPWVVIPDGAMAVPEYYDMKQTWPPDAFDRLIAAVSEGGG